MNEREELAEVVWDLALRHLGVATSSSKHMADELLAAGYRKPRQVTTVEELDALPYNSIVMFDEGWRTSVAERQAESMRWCVPGCLEYIRPEALLPATVIHEGGAL